MMTLSGLELVQIQSQVRSLPTMGHLFIPVAGDTLRCLQAGATLGFAPQQMEISYMRVYDCDASNILQKFDWNPEGGPMYLTGEWSNFCVVFRGNVENLGRCIQLLAVKRCLAVPGPRRGWKVLGFET